MGRQPGYVVVMYSYKDALTLTRKEPVLRQMTEQVNFKPFMGSKDYNKFATAHGLSQIDHIESETHLPSWIMRGEQLVEDLEGMDEAKLARDLAGHSAELQVAPQVSLLP